MSINFFDKFQKNVFFLLYLLIYYKIFKLKISTIIPISIPTKIFKSIHTAKPIIKHIKKDITIPTIIKITIITARMTAIIPTKISITKIKSIPNDIPYKLVL